MAKAMTKDAQIAALRETNESLTADVVSLSDGIGALEAEIVTERATAAARVAEAQAKTRDALAMTAGDAAADLIQQIEALKLSLSIAEVQRDAFERSRDEMEAEMEKVGSHWKEKAERAEADLDEATERHGDEMDALREKLEKENEEEIARIADEKSDELENLRADLDTYLADLGYPRDPHPSTISCPSLRRLVAAL